VEVYLLDWREDAKKKAAEEAVKLVKDGWVVGLGSGSTVAYAVLSLGKRIREEKLNIKVVPTSYQIFFLALNEKIPVTTLDENPRIDFTIDGADEVDKNLNLIKGGGGALTREKIVAFASEKYVVIVDETKLVKKLGLRFPVPVEVLPFAVSFVTKEIGKFWSNIKIREGKGKVGPVITDNGNFIVDVYCGEIDNPKSVEEKLKRIPGVVETGLFIGIVDMLYVGKKDGKVEVLTKV